MHCGYLLEPCEAVTVQLKLLRFEFWLRNLDDFDNTVLCYKNDILDKKRLYLAVVQVSRSCG